MEHHKKVHNGKNRQTGRKVQSRKSGQSKTKVTGRVVGKPRAAMPTLPRPKPRCCQTPEQRQVLNERMFAELSTIRWDREWSEVRGTWKRVIPRHFVAKYRRHMAHFRAYLRERMEH
jgi:hypothetical protein